jgi:hypothetical protein
MVRMTVYIAPFFKAVLSTKPVLSKPKLWHPLSRGEGTEG